MVTAMSVLSSRWGRGSTVPITAAIANAIFDAVGVKLRELPFTPERVLSAMKA